MNSWMRHDRFNHGSVPFLLLFLLGALVVPPTGHAQQGIAKAEYGHGLTAQEAEAGWISLFDGKTPFGWTGAKVDGGQLSGGTTTTEFGNAEVRAEFAHGGTLTAGGKEIPVSPGRFALPETGRRGPICLGGGAAVRHLAVRPLGLESLFNGRDLTGWQRVERPNLPAEKRPIWTVVGGTLQVVGGPGALEYQGRHYGDLILQIDARTRAPHANSGVFLRSVPRRFILGYEAQIHNRCEDGDPDKPARYSTGGIDDRQNARRLVSRDHEYFRLTVIARGPHLATWVNGYQLTDWTDTRPQHENPRQGLRTAPGTIQLQAHDPQTDVEFKTIRVAELK
jgi:hypothetical protein